jgi:hypothetical protein
LPGDPGPCRAGPDSLVKRAVPSGNLFLNQNGPGAVDGHQSVENGDCVRECLGERHAAEVGFVQGADHFHCPGQRQRRIQPFQIRRARRDPRFRKGDAGGLKF